MSTERRVRIYPDNNVRNRYRRYRDAHRAYGWRPLSFREWASGWGKNPASYSVGPETRVTLGLVDEVRP